MTFAASILRRSVASLLTVAGVLAATALIVPLARGHPCDLLADARVRASCKSQDWMAASPTRWMARAVRGDLGTSLAQRRPVATLIAERLPRTLMLTLTAVAIQLLLGIVAGIVLAVRAGGWLDPLLSTALFVLDAIPGFWLGIMLILIFSVTLHWLPAGGLGVQPFEDPGLAAGLSERLRHLVLPALALSLGGAATIARFLRSGLIDALRSPFVQAARAAGIGERTILVRYAMRNSLLPLITILGLSFPHLIGGAVIVEKVFAWPGIGSLAADAVMQRDLPVILATNLLFAVFVVLGNLVADLLYLCADPRIRSSSVG